MKTKFRNSELEIIGFKMYYNEALKFIQFDIAVDNLVKNIRTNIKIHHDKDCKPESILGVLFKTNPVLLYESNRFFVYDKAKLSEIVTTLKLMY